MRTPIGLSLAWAGLASIILTTVWLGWNGDDTARSAPPIYECQQLQQQCARDCSDMFPSQVPDYQPQVDLCQAQSATACQQHARQCPQAPPDTQPTAHH